MGITNTFFDKSGLITSVGLVLVFLVVFPLLVPWPQMVLPEGVALRTTDCPVGAGLLRPSGCSQRPRMPEVMGCTSELSPHFETWFIRSWIGFWQIIWQKIVSYLGNQESKLLSISSVPLNYLFYIYLFLGCAGSLFCDRAFSSCGEQGLFSSCSVWASHCSGFLCWGAQALGTQAQWWQLLGSRAQAQ